MVRALKALPLGLAIVALIVCAAFAASCGSSTTQARFVNAIEDSKTGLDFEVNGVRDFTDLLFLSFQPTSGYATIPAGNDMVVALATGTTTPPVFSQTISLNSGVQYTLVAAGPLSGSVDIMNPVDNNTEPADGSVNFRVINASSFGPTGSGGAVDVYILPNPSPCSPGSTGCTPTVSALAYTDTSSYITLPYNSEGNGWTLIVTVAGNPTPYFTDSIGGFGSSTLGAICTLVLTDIQDGSAMNKNPLVFQDLNASGCAVN